MTIPISTFCCYFACACATNSSWYIDNKTQTSKNFHSRFCVFDGQSRQNTRCWAKEWNCARLEYELRTILIEKNRAMSTFKLEQSVAFIWISAFFFSVWREKPKTIFNRFSCFNGCGNCLDHWNADSYICFCTQSKTHHGEFNWTRRKEILFNCTRS